MTTGIPSHLRAFQEALIVAPPKVEAARRTGETHAPRWYAPCIPAVCRSRDPLPSGGATRHRTREACSCEEASRAIAGLGLLAGGPDTRAVSQILAAFARRKRQSSSWVEPTGRGSRLPA